MILRTLGYGLSVFSLWVVICFLNATFLASIHTAGSEILWYEGAQEVIRQVTHII
jgi:hypothetical protein